MKYDKVFLDASFVIALLNKNDKHHVQANTLIDFLFKAREVWTTELVLSEIGNTLSRGNKMSVLRFIKSCYRTENMKIPMWSKPSSIHPIAERHVYFPRTIKQRIEDSRSQVFVVLLRCPFPPSSPFPSCSPGGGDHG